MRARLVVGGRLALALGLLLALVGPAAAQGLVQAVGPIGMTVSDMERSVAFYSRVLGFETVSNVEVQGEAWERLQGVFGLRMRVVRMRLGDEAIELTEYLTPRGRPVPADSRSNDRWFQHVAIIVSDMDRAYARLREHNVEHASPAPQRLPDWNPSAGGIRAFYFKDPDGHTLEILWFPPDKGQARWQQRGGRLFLGIDHTAIVVADTGRSLACYRDALGLRVVGESENHGPEQERLNSVFGARLRITTLKAARGPGVELLEYLTPRDGRPAPADARANDLAHWQTRLLVGDAEAAHRVVRTGACGGIISPGVVAPGEPGLGFDRGALLRDPDGHALQVVQPWTRCGDSSEHTRRRTSMTEDFEYVSHTRLEYHEGLRRAFLGDVTEPVVYGVQGKLREYYGAKEGPPIASTLDHIVAAVAGWMYGTLRGALAGRKIAFDRETFKATVDGRISGIGKTIRIKSIHVHYDVAVPAEAAEATERALAVHVQGCPAHQSVKDAIAITWDATLRAGDRMVSVRSEESDAATA